MCAPDIPSPPPSPVIPRAPTEVNPSILAARNRARSLVAASSGFQSTILTSGRGVNTSAGRAVPTLLGSRSQSQGSSVGRPATPTDVSLPTGPPNPVQPIIPPGIGSEFYEDFLRRGGGEFARPARNKGGRSGSLIGGSGTLTSGGGTSLVTSGGSRFGGGGF